jgi:hypothetical protein
VEFKRQFLLKKKQNKKINNRLIILHQQIIISKIIKDKRIYSKVLKYHISFFRPVAKFIFSMVRGRCTGYYNGFGQGGG